MVNELARQYIMVTPVKNEEKYLPKMIQSIINQTIRPVLWVIVDDRSTDHTPDIINKTKEKYNWVKSIKLGDGIRDRGMHLAEIIKKGFDFAYEYSKKERIYFDYLGNVDADVILETTYFEKLIEKFENNSCLGAASGGEWLVNTEKMKYLKGRYPSGGNVLYRKKCYDDCGGIPISFVWDSVMNTKAKLRGWNIKRFDDCRVFVMRGYNNAEGLWMGYKKYGESDYIVNYNSIYAIVKGLKLLFEKPFYIGFAYLFGYLKSLILRKKQIEDKEVRHYFWYIRPKETNIYYINMLKNKLKWLCKEKTLFP